MANPIKPLPTIEGIDARILLRDLNNPENITEKERKFFKEMRDM